MFSYIPAFSLVCLVFSRSVLHHTCYEDGVLGFGVGTLLAYTLADLGSRFLPAALPLAGQKKPNSRHSI